MQRADGVPVAVGHMNPPVPARRLWGALTHLCTRLLHGVGAYLLLAVGLMLAAAGILLVGLAGMLAIPVIAGALVAVLYRPLRPTVKRLPAALGRAVVAVAVWWLLACRAAARRERAAAAHYRSSAIPISYRPLPDGHIARLRVMTADPATWRDLAYLIVGPALVLAALLLVGAICVGAVAAIASGLTGQWVDPAWTNPLRWVAIATGIGALGIAPFVTTGLARGTAAVAAAMLATGESARMRAELEEQRLRRQLAVDAAERERRRIERDLHDGAQQRLVALGISLGLARETLPDDPVAGAALVAEAHGEAKRALAELRDLARGIHPAILADRGLDAALSDLVRRAPVPVSVIVTMPRRPQTSVESAAYFVVAEGLTNVSRHASASRAMVSITQHDGLLVVEISDDGVGGADPESGTGLSGLADRVTALNGRMTIDSPAGGPTTIRAEIPCGS